MYHWPLVRCILNRRRRVRIFDGIQHRIKEMGPNHDVAGSNFGHGLFRRIFAFDLVPLRLLGLGPIPLEDAIAQPFFLRPFKRGEKDRTIIPPVSAYATEQTFATKVPVYTFPR